MRLTVIAVLAAATAFAYTGAIDTVGGTTFDSQGSGPAHQWVVRDPRYGVHVAWMYSTQGSSWPDRNVRYNFCDYSTGGWNWLDPVDFMVSGTNSRSARCGYGTMDVVPSDGAALIACHYAPYPMQFCPTALRDLAPGVGIFDECVGEPDVTGWFLPAIGVTQDGTISSLVIKFQVSDNLYFTRTTPWCTWEVPVAWNQTGAFGHNLAASHASNKLLATWMSGSNNELTLAYRTSSDAGASWEDVHTLTPPSAYGGDTGTVCFQGAAGLFDRDDNWQVATVLAPLINDSAYQNPAQLWLYNSGTNEWHMIHRAEAGTLAGDLGSASICGKPSPGQDPVSGRMYAAWEQFDSLNVEPTTSLLRADVWVASSPDGADWSGQERLTVPDNSSKRFPRIGTNCSGDSLAIGFEVDSIAGFNSDGTGGLSRNPICVWQGSGVGIAEQGRQRLEAGRARPNPAARFTVAAGAAARSVTVRDAAGRLVRELVVSDGVAAWDGRDLRGRNVEPGCYFASWPGGNTKLVLAR